MRRERVRNDLLTGLGLMTAAAVVFVSFSGSPRATGQAIAAGDAVGAAQIDRTPAGTASVVAARRD